MRFTILVIALFGTGTSATAQEAVDGGLPPSTGLGFIENLGQFDPEVRFVVRSRGLIAQLAADAVHWNLMSARSSAAPRPGRHERGNTRREREVTAHRFA